MGYRFEWDAKKERANRAKHGVAFDEAMTAFGDPQALLEHDPDHSFAESRYLLLGQSKRGRLLVVSFTDRPPNTRIISARRATPRERAQYEEED
jgi:uncharacterized protein